MKTSEFIERVLEVEGVVSHKNCDNCVVTFIGRDDITLAKVRVNETHSFDTSWNGFYELNKQSKDRLLALLYHYAITPLEEREEPKRYKLKHKLVRGCGYLNYHECDKELEFSTGRQTDIYKTAFTIQEWEALTEQTWEDLLLQFKAIGEEKK